MPSRRSASTTSRCRHRRPASGPPYRRRAGDAGRLGHRPPSHHDSEEPPMIPAAFEYVRADSPDAAIAALTEHGDDAKLLAGGMSLIPLMKLRLATPTVVVDVGRLRDLSYVRAGGDHVAIGALTRHRDLETNDLLAGECAVVRAVA